MSRYAISDLHGQLDLFNQVKEFINDDDIVYALGDFGDRGPEPWRTLQAVLDNPQFIYLMGNHDLMLLNAIDLYLREGDEALSHLYGRVNDRDAIGICYLNGGLETLQGWINDPARNYYYQKLSMAPLEVRLAAYDKKHFIYLTHAGLTPGVLEGENIEDFVWDRQHFYDKWDSKGHLSIGGHSPIEYLVKHLYLHNQEYELKEGCLFYNNGSKICIDKGSYYTGETVLLNIDTLKGHIFTTKGESNEKNNA